MPTALKDPVIVVVQLTGGNDYLNTVIPYADDLYHKARPTLRQSKEEVIRLDDHVGLNSSMRGFRSMWDAGHLAVVQGVGSNLKTTLGSVQTALAPAA